jgi:glycosyltransferase involved in cell wall biosynthesis
VRIGVMLRAIEEKGGVGVYTRNLTRELLDMDRENEYVLFYRSVAASGQFADRPNVRERVLGGSGKFIWDQMAVPWACLREGIDVLLHPKFTVPFLAPCPAVMVVHGADWFIPEQAQYYETLDVQYMRRVMPWYFRKSAVVISVSELTTQNFERVLNLPPGKIRTVYFAPARHFSPVGSTQRLGEVRTRYRLPERFVFTLTKRFGTGRKNFSGLLAAYAHYHGAASEPLPLVVGGADLEELRPLHAIPDDGWGADVIFPGWLDQADLPAIYSQADLFVYPSNLEAFPIPITEAMACGAPIVTSAANGLEEIAGEAALFVPPDDPVAIAAAITRVLEEPSLAESLRRRGIERSERYSWDRCARQTLSILEEVAAG